MDAKKVIEFAKERKVDMVKLKFMGFPGFCQHFFSVTACEMEVLILSHGGSSLSRGS